MLLLRAKQECFQAVKRHWSQSLTTLKSLCSEGLATNVFPAFMTSFTKFGMVYQNQSSAVDIQTWGRKLHQECSKMFALLFQIKKKNKSVTVNECLIFVEINWTILLSPSVIPYCGSNLIVIILYCKIWANNC